MSNLYIYFLNVLIIALPLALFEIVTEKDKGWGSGWSKSKWYAKPFAPKSSLVRFLTKILNIEHPLVYHFIVFAVIIPAIFIFEYFYLTKDILLLLASFIGVIALEDFLWFLLNWNFDSRRQLLKGPNGTIWWHKRWIKISKNTYLPASYSAFLLSLLLLILSL